MVEMQPVAVDLTQDQSVLQILPRLPLRSSQELGWHGLYAQYHDQPAWETPEYYQPQHMLLVHYAAPAVKAERVLDGRRQQEQIGNGNVVIIPANVHNQANWLRKSAFTLLFLDPAHLAQTAHEAINSDRVELIPQFAMVDPLIEQIGRSLTAELETSGLGSRLLVDSLTTTLSIHLLRTYAVWQQPLRDYAGGLSQRKLQQAIDYIHAYLAQDLRLDAIAQTLDMSQYYFARLFKQSMGISPYQYVLQQRVERAKQLLKQPELSIADIALQCGFASQSHLNDHFRRLTGVTPKAFRDA